MEHVWYDWSAVMLSQWLCENLDGMQLSGLSVVCDVLIWLTVIMWLAGLIKAQLTGLVLNYGISNTVVLEIP